MTEDQIMQWMRDKVKKDGFSDAAALAEEFLKSHDIGNCLNPEFAKAMDAGYKIAQEVYGF